MNWDEESQRNNNGKVVYQFVTGEITAEDYLKSGEKYHGPAFELFLYATEKLSGFGELRDIYFLRHFLTFLLFFVGVIFFYRLCYQIFKDRWLALTGAIFLVLSPRIFGDAFHNSKDLPFLSLFAIALFTHERLTSTITIKNAIVHGLVCGLLIAVRITGIILPIFTIMMLIFNQRSKALMPAALYIASFIMSTILFWPVLWLGSVEHFLAAWNEMSHYEWFGTVLYQGEMIRPADLPWHYLPVWISITTPLPYLLLFATGLLSLFFIKAERIRLFFYAGLFSAPILSVIILKSSVYDGWRHLFFVYISFLIVCIYGLQFLLSRSVKYLNGKKILWSITILIGGSVLYSMIIMHPHQYVYFNRIAGNSLMEVQFRYELDYWGVSLKQLYERLLEEDKRKEIRIYPETDPGRLNLYLLTKEDRNRIKITAKDSADYAITHYRFYTSHPQCTGECIFLEMEGARIAAAVQ